MEAEKGQEVKRKDEGTLREEGKRTRGWPQMFEVR